MKSFAKQPPKKKLASEADLVERLARCAEDRGMHAAHVVEFPARLKAAGIDPAACTPHVVRAAQAFQRAMIAACYARLEDWFSSMRKEKHLSYRCEACGCAVPAGTPRKTFPFFKSDGKQLETELPVCQKCHDYLKLNGADKRALLAELKQKALAAPAAKRAPAVPAPPVVARAPEAVDL